MAITLSDYLKPNISVPVDYRQGPFATTAAANAAVISNYRYTGLTVLITNGSTVDEYWWKAGTADGDLVLKTTGGGAYTLPTASASALGGVKVGTGLSIDANGILTSSGGGTALPSQSGNSGKYLTTNGTSVSWGTIVGGALAATGVTAGTYTNAKITVNTYGQITSASSGLDPIIASLIF